MKSLANCLRHGLVIGHLAIRRQFSNFNARKSGCYYKVLGLEPGVTVEEIRRKFFEMAKVHHPDISTDPRSNQIFQELSEAYGIFLKKDWELKDPLSPMNFYSEMFDRKVEIDQKSADVA